MNSLNINTDMREYRKGRYYCSLVAYVQWRPWGAAQQNSNRQPLRHLLLSHECVLVRPRLPVRVAGRDCGRFGFMGGTCDSVRRGLKFTQPRSKSTGSHFSGDSNATCNGTRTRVAPLQCTLPSSRAAAAVARWSRSSFTFGSTINSFTTPTFLLKSANLYNVLPVSNHL